MSFGKYSPTVHPRYAADEQWFEKNCAEPFAQYDKEGFDMYGYNAEGKDRNGIDENEYLLMDEQDQENAIEQAFIDFHNGRCSP